MTARPLQSLAALGLLAAMVSGCGAPPSYALPTCPPAVGSDVLLLMAQSVPSATHVPCIKEFPAGWSFGGQNIESGRAEFWLYSDRAGERAITVLLTPTCDVSGGVEVPTDADEAGMTRYEEPESLPPAFKGNRYYVFPGGCVTYRFDFARGGSFALAVEATEALSFVARREGVNALRDEGLVLCGAGVDCPG